MLHIQPCLSARFTNKCVSILDIYATSSHMVWASCAQGGCKRGGWYTLPDAVWTGGRWLMRHLTFIVRSYTASEWDLLKTLPGKTNCDYLPSCVLTVLICNFQHNSVKAWPATSKWQDRNTRQSQGTSSTLAAQWDCWMKVWIFFCKKLGELQTHCSTFQSKNQG